MGSLNDKLLTVILVLLLGLSPLQGAVASLLDTPAQGMGMHQMMDHEGEMNTVSPQQMCPDCPQQMGENGCQTHIGSATHCTGCIVGILSATTALFTPALVDSVRPSNDGFTSHYQTSLYRPPRG